jgi:glutamine amidotransferase
LEAEKLILPGVGNFAIAMEWLKSAKLDNVIRHKVINEKAPILGICLGMQLFATFGEEGGGREGLNFIRGKTSYHRASQCGLPLPHIGWNDVKFNGIRIFESIPYNSCFYFVHSYEFIPTEPVEVAYSNYGVDFVAMVKKENIIGVQFHPEKSQGAGLRLLKNFCEGRF